MGSYQRAVRHGTPAFRIYDSWLQKQLSASGLSLGEIVAPGSDERERLNHCQGMGEMKLAGLRARSAMARRLPAGASKLTDEVTAGIGAIVNLTRGGRKTLVLCSMWVDPSHRGQGLWQRLLLDLMYETSPHSLELGSGLVTAFSCNKKLHKCLVSIGWKEGECPRGIILDCSDVRDAMQRAVLGFQDQPYHDTQRGPSYRDTYGGEMEPTDNGSHAVCAHCRLKED